MRSLQKTFAAVASSLALMMVVSLSGVVQATDAASQAEPVPEVVLDPENTLNLYLKDDGLVVIKLRPDLAPNHVARLKTLSREKFYDGIIFHRVIPDFMAQTGDPTGTGSGGSDYPDVRAEFTKKASFGKAGVLGMARSQHPDSANSQFFITLDDARFLDRNYTIFGEVVSGMEYVNAISVGEPPANPDKIIKMRVAADPQD